MTTQTASPPTHESVRARTFRNILAAIDPFADRYPALQHALESIEHGARVKLIGSARPLPSAVYMWPSVPAELAIQPFSECQGRLLEVADQLLPEHVRLEVEVHAGPLRQAVKSALARGDYDLVTVDRAPTRWRTRRVFSRRLSIGRPVLLVESLPR
jgi:hypothetical protein